MMAPSSASEYLDMREAIAPGVPFHGPAKTEVLRRYHELLGVDPWPQRNPCAQPVSLGRRDLPRLLAGSYIAADKSDGVRYTLFLVEVDGQAYSLLIDRKLAMFHVPVAAARPVYAGSIFDGELVWTQCQGPVGGRAHCFLVFDVAAFRGDASVASKNLVARLEVLRSAFDLGDSTACSPGDAARLARAGKIVCGGSKHGLSFRVKQCFRLSDLDVLLRQIPTLPYPVDGLVFTPIERPVGRGTDEALFKLRFHHSLDLELGPGDELLVGVGGGPSTASQRLPLAALGLGFGKAPGFAEALQQLRLAATRDPGRKRDEPIIVECAVKDAAAPTLSSPRLRHDRSHPNAARTAVATLTNLREDVRPEELLAGLRGSMGGVQISEAGHGIH